MPVCPIIHSPGEIVLAVFSVLLGSVSSFAITGGMRTERSKKSKKNLKIEFIKSPSDESSTSYFIKHLKQKTYSCQSEGYLSIKLAVSFQPSAFSAPDTRPAF